MDRKQIIAVVIIAAVILGFILIFSGILPGGRKPKPPPAILEFWSPEGDKDAWEQIIYPYREANSHVEIKYTKIDEETYEETLVNRLAEGRGPDIFLLKNSWIGKHKDKIYPLPQPNLQFFVKDFQTRFVEVASDDLISPDGQILGLPLFVDTPALFYNKDIFNSSGVADPPKTWDEVVAVSQKLTQTTEFGDIIRSGIALGTFNNIESAFESISSLILQNGEEIIGMDQRVNIGKKTQEAVSFYTSFADPTKSHFSWTPRTKNSFEAFTDETAVMTVGMAADIKRTKAKNPHFNLGVSQFPQKKQPAKAVLYGRYFFPTVSISTKNPLEAWKFLLFATSRDYAQKYLEKTSLPPARRDLISQGTASAELDVFYNQSLIAKSWPIPDEDATTKLFSNMIESVVSRIVTVEAALNDFSQKLQFLISK